MEHLTSPPAAPGQCGSEPARALLSSLQQLGLRIQLLHNSHVRMHGRFMVMSVRVHGWLAPCSLQAYSPVLVVTPPQPSLFPASCVQDGRFACHLGKETAQGFAGAWRRLSRGAAARLAHQLAVCLDSCADPYAYVLCIHGVGRSVSP